MFFIPSLNYDSNYFHSSTHSFNECFKPEQRMQVSTSTVKCASGRWYEIKWNDSSKHQPPITDQESTSLNDKRSQTSLHVLIGIKGRGHIKDGLLFTVPTCFLEAVQVPHGVHESQGECSSWRPGVDGDEKRRCEKNRAHVHCRQPRSSGGLSILSLIRMQIVAAPVNQEELRLAQPLEAELIWQ